MIGLLNINGLLIKTLERDDENNKMDHFFYSDICFKTFLERDKIFLFLNIGICNYD